jgi:hypothetical protein
VKKLWCDAWQVKFHGYDSFELRHIRQSDSQPSFAHVFHLGSETLSEVIAKPHRQVNVVSEIPAMFALHLRNRNVKNASQSSFLHRLVEYKVCS